jgi:hypothetical protein
MTIPECTDNGAMDLKANTKDITDNLRGLVIILSIIIAYTMLFSLFYPLSIYSYSPFLGVFLQNPTSLFYLTFSFASVGIILKNPKRITLNIFLLSTLFACLVWVSIQSQYYYYNWTPFIPYYAPTINACARIPSDSLIFLQSLGIWHT